jgi:EAL domain-containing protein (putative c-di-GMP-specific phosphodiesterase class I)
MHALIFELRDAGRLERIHGAAVAAVVRKDIDAGFARVASDVLQLHEAATPPLRPRWGLWLVPFRLRRLEILADAAEQLAAIADAGIELTRRMLRGELGAAAGIHCDFRLGVVPIGDGALDARGVRSRAARGAARLPWASRPAPQAERDELLDIILNRRITVHLQPIVSLEQPGTVGYEALARGPVGSPLYGADRLFPAASRHGLTAELDLACLTSALEVSPRLPADRWLSVNLTPELFDTAGLRRLQEAGSFSSGKVFELTEHLPVRSPGRLARNSARLQASGARLAVDDAGCGFFNMDTVRAVSPAIVKVCITVIRRIERGPRVTAALRRTVRAIREIGAAALAEGVETAAQAELARDCGFSLAQGYHFGRPLPAAETLSLN